MYDAMSDGQWSGPPEDIALAKTSPRPQRRNLRHAASTGAYRWLARRKIVRRVPGEHFHVRHHTVRMHGLPDALDGLCIAHLTDLHVGSILTPDRLPRIVESVNRINADLIAVTGDMLDHSNACLEPVADAMAQLDAPLGAYFVLGNHDYREDIDRVVAAFNKRGLPLLINQVVHLPVGNARITLGGIDYAEHDDTLAQHVRSVVRHMPECDLRVLLAHHPHAFDAAHAAGIHLTLSGHTHGGQLLLRPHTLTRPSLGLGNLAWRYAQGLYHRDTSRLFVSSGIGSAFPLRVRCPAEISVLNLHAA